MYMYLHALLFVDEEKEEEEEEGKETPTWGSAVAGVSGACRLLGHVHTRASRRRVAVIWMHD